MLGVMGFLIATVPAGAGDLPGAGMLLSIPLRASLPLTEVGCLSIQNTSGLLGCLLSSH